MFLKKRNPLLTFLLVIFTVFSMQAADIWVAVNGKDTNEGTKASPLATVHMALRKARELRRLKDASIKGGIHIIIKDGTYYLDEPLFVRPEDSGTADSPTTIEADVNAKPIFNGGIAIKNWKKTTTSINGLKTGAVWVADAPTIAGNVINEDILGSMEFACKVAGSKLIVVLGHSKCGAIKGACNHVELGNLTGLLEKVQPAIEKVKEQGSDTVNPAFIEAVAHANTLHTMEEVLKRSPILKEMFENGEIGIAAGYYSVETGEVKFIKEKVLSPLAEPDYYR